VGGGNSEFRAPDREFEAPEVLNRIVAVEDAEVRPMLWATLYFFLLLASYFVIRPIRDEMGVAGGVRNLPWLFLGTLIGMLLVHPLFTALVSRMPRRIFIPLSYTFFAANLIAFWLFFLSFSDAAGIWTGRVFFVWTSVFNLFVVSIFWSLMADLFRPEQAKRLFGFVAVGGTFGAVTGSSITAFLAARVGPTNLLLVSAAILGMAMLAARMLMSTVSRSRSKDDSLRQPTARTEEPVGGGVLDGIRTVFSSSYLLGIVGYMMFYTVTATILYFQQAEIVQASFAERAARTVFFARIDLAVNVLTALIQVFFTGRIVRNIGVRLSLATLPLVCIFGFAALGDNTTLIALAGFQILRRTSNYAIARPCREMLYTVIPRDAKYKAKNFIDTFVYRLGDQTGAWSYAGLAALGFTAATISQLAIPLAAAWMLIGLWLGRRQREMATA
jgi:AAA family ATP:ADP antiporter